MSYTYRMDAEDWLLIGYCIGVLLYWALDRMGLIATTEPQSTGQTWRLDERALSRLEDGEQVTVPRWHGGELVLNGSDVIPVEAESEESEE